AADELAARLRIVDAQEHVGAEVRRRPRPKHGRLDFMQVEFRRARRKILADGFLSGQHGRIPFLRPGRLRPGLDRTIRRCAYPTLSSSSSTAFPPRSSLWASAKERPGWETYQASAVIWFLTSQSLITELRIPGQPRQLQNRMSIEFGIFVTKSS